MYKRRKASCPLGHILQQEKTKVKLESFLQQFPSNFKIHVPSSIICSRCNSNIYADQQPTFATCSQCNFNLCRNCIADSSPTSAMTYNEVDHCSRKRKGRDDTHDTFMSCDDDYDDPNKINRSIRYNNKRPNYTQFPRVSYYLYPEPCNYGWKFTGCDITSKKEFFEMTVENGLVLLDFDFMTGTVRTVLDDQTNGSIILFGKGKSLLPDVYVKILQNPHYRDTKFQRRMYWINQFKIMWNSQSTKLGAMGKKVPGQSFPCVQHTVDQVN